MPTSWTPPPPWTDPATLLAEDTAASEALDVDVALRCSVLAMHKDRFPADGLETFELAAWLLTGDRNALAMPVAASLEIRASVLGIVVALHNLGDVLGTVADPLDAAAQLDAWVRSSVIGPVPRHYITNQVIPTAPPGRTRVEYKRFRTAGPNGDGYVPGVPDDVL